MFASAFSIVLPPYLPVKGNRPSFARAARPQRAEPLYERFCDALGVEVARGVFGALMAVERVNDGPATIVLE